MTLVYLADAKPEERSALRLLFLDLEMEVAGEAADWPTVLAQMPASHADMILVEWTLVSAAPATAVHELRRACPGVLVIVVLSYPEVLEQAALSAGADVFITRNENAERVAKLLRAAAAMVPIYESAVAR